MAHTHLKVHRYILGNSGIACGTDDFRWPSNYIGLVQWATRHIMWGVLAIDSYRMRSIYRYFIPGLIPNFRRNGLFRSHALLVSILR